MKKMDIVKRVLAVAITVSLSVCMFGCSKENVVEEVETVATTSGPISLTRDNLEDYLYMQGSFENGNTIANRSGIGYTSYGTLHLETEGIEEGRFQEVEVKVRCTSTQHAFNNSIALMFEGVSPNWRIYDNNGFTTDDLTITFRVNPQGEFENDYSIACELNDEYLSGYCDFQIISVSGTFIPDN